MNADRLPVLDDRLPLVAITQGDPAGVGPETIVRAWSNPALLRCCRPVVVGHPEIFARAAKLFAPHSSIEVVARPADARPSATVIPCLAVGTDEVLDLRPGTIDARGGQAAYVALVAAARLALDGQIDALTTAPLHKKALWLAGHHYPGHTELLAELCAVEQFAMMLHLSPPTDNETGAAGDSASPSPSPIVGPLGLSIVHVTLHMALKDVFAALTPAAVLEKARLIDAFVRRLTGQQPRIGVCALNPHAGEDGLFGDEEQTVIAPAIERGRDEGLKLSDPLPADTLIARARDGEFDGVVAMYHDQGHIAIKLLAMHRAVNVTLGLPIVRTSVAHGTAFDLAWKGRAETTGLIAALQVASRLAKPRG